MIKTRSRCCGPTGDGVKREVRGGLNEDREDGKGGEDNLGRVGNTCNGSEPKDMENTVKG